MTGALSEVGRVEAGEPNSEQDFVAVQAISATPRPDTDETRAYLLTGLLRCGLCGRLLASHWVYRSPGYRCRHGHTRRWKRPRAVERG